MNRRYKSGVMGSAMNFTRMNAVIENITLRTHYNWCVRLNASQDYERSLRDPLRPQIFFYGFRKFVSVSFVTSHFVFVQKWHGLVWLCAARDYTVNIKYSTTIWIPYRLRAAVSSIGRKSDVILPMMELLAYSSIGRKTKPSIRPVWQAESGTHANLGTFNLKPTILNKTYKSI